MSPTQYRVSSAYTVNKGDDNALMELLETHGPVTVSVYTGGGLPFYKSGIYAVNADVCAGKASGIKLDILSKTNN